MHDNEPRRERLHRMHLPRRMRPRVLFNLGSWSALTDDGCRLPSLELVSSCGGQDPSLLTYGINPGEKVRNRVDFTVPRNVEKMQL